MLRYWEIIAARQVVSPIRPPQQSF